ncbi:copper resistance D family protein [Salinimonas lutimaris]|uniref:copper resistance D family protein n=1 Tax=Salinimonas lutimaris TaxID=914153 RepID=UPI0010C021D4|nr:CopD family protein [Salinimonas lutimaris]
MEMYIWNTLIIVCKALFYAGTAGIAGYAFLQTFGFEKSTQTLPTAYARKITRYFIYVFTLTVISVPIWFLAKVGAFSESGISGALDPTMLSIMWDSPVGHMAQVRGGATVFALLSLLVATRLGFQHMVIRVCMLLALAVALYSYTLAGHISEQGLIEKMLLIVHVFVMSWWFGALIPLKLGCRYLPVEQTKSLMHKFGVSAQFLVGLMIIVGVLMALQLFDNISQLFTSAYGLTLMAKIGCVGALLLIAARHKRKLVPMLKNQQAVDKLSRSISLEITLAATLLLITAALTSVVGPDFS